MVFIFMSDTLTNSVEMDYFEDCTTHRINFSKLGDVPDRLLPVSPLPAQDTPTEGQGQGLVHEKKSR